ncbi:MAG TPA: hypothetical protein VFF20_04990 [Pseudogracilibacillus sp.]|nr:hypothetical protein [Pseudogracilibacillus sp.]
MELNIKQLQNTIQTLVQNNVFSIEELKTLNDVQIKAMKSVGTKKFKEIKELIKVNEEIDVFKYFGPDSIKPEKMIGFFQKHQIHQGNILVHKLAKISEIEKLTKGKIEAFLTFKHRVLCDEYNDTLCHGEQSKDDVIDDIMQMTKKYLESFLTIETIKSIEADLYVLVSGIGLENVDIDKYGAEIVSFLDVEYILMQNNNDLDKEILYQIIYRERKEISMFKLKQKLQAVHIFNQNRLQELLQALLQEGYIVYTSHGLKHNMPSVLQYVEYNQAVYPYTYERIQGKTLEEIGAKEGVTRERVRQKFVKEVEGIPLERLYETRYVPFYESYNLTEEEFCKIFQINEQQYNFLKLFYSQKHPDELESKEVLMDSEKLDMKEQKHLLEIINRNYIVIDNHRIERSKLGIVTYAISLFARETIHLLDFQEKLIGFCEEHGVEEEFDFSETRALEGIVVRVPRSLWKYGRTFRYYEVDQELIENSLSQVVFYRYMNQEVSTQRIFSDYEELFLEIDIQDEYELHNLLRKNEHLIPDYVSFSRTPILEVGKTDREEQVINLLIEHSPIEKNDFAALYSEKYGVLLETVKANYLPMLHEFAEGAILDADTPPVDSKTLAWLNDYLTEDFYFKEDIYKMYATEFKGEVMRDYVFNLVDYTNYAEFILKGKNVRADLYFEKEFFQKPMFKIHDKRLKYLGSFRKQWESLRTSLDIFEFAENEFIHFRTMHEKTGIEKLEIIQLVDEILEEVGDKYFTVPMIEPIIENSPLYLLGFDDIFYESILKGHQSLRFHYMGGRVVFRQTKEKFYIHELLEEVVGRMKMIDIYELIDYLEETYSIPLTKESIIKRTEMSDLYYQPGLEMMFQDMEQYYEYMEED